MDLNLYWPQNIPISETNIIYIVSQIHLSSWLHLVAVNGDCILQCSFLKYFVMWFARAEYACHVIDNDL